MENLFATDNEIPCLDMKANRESYGNTLSGTERCTVRVDRGLSE